MARNGRNGTHRNTAPTNGVVRVAVYCRQSVADDSEFNSLEAQAQAIRSYIDSQRGEGWVALPDDYVDRGVSGATVERPAFQRLLHDIGEGQVDVVATYKIDRLSRSLPDFARIMEFFEKHGVAFTAITQQFNSATSMGKLTLNILMSFAEFERQVISERTRDKMAATRKRGMWTGGRPVLGFDVQDKKLVVNKKEAERVRAIFDLYLERGSLQAVVEELARRDWKNKTYRASTGKVLPGLAFDKNGVHRILTNALYVGKVEFGGETYQGAHDAIIDANVWHAVQALLEKHRNPNGNGKRRQGDALLSGLLRCGACGASFSHNTTASGNRRYRYYVCQTRQKKGAKACPESRVSGPEIEKFVVEQIMAIGKDPRLAAHAVKAAGKVLEKRKAEVEADVKRLKKDEQALAMEKANLLDALGEGGSGKKAIIGRLGEIESALEDLASKVETAEKELTALGHAAIDDQNLRAALASFTPVWGELFPKERARIIHLLIEQITYAAREDRIDITFRPCGIRALAAEHAEAVE